MRARVRVRVRRVRARVRVRVRVGAGSFRPSGVLNSSSAASRSESAWVRGRVRERLG